MKRLLCVEGAQKGQRYPIEADSLVLGRDRDSDIPIDDPGSSRSHCVIYQQAGQLYLRDEGSTNGTFVNARRVSETRLNHGDRITIGDTVILIESVVSGPAPRVVVSDAIHDSSGDITVQMDSTVLLAPDQIETVQAQGHWHFLALFSFISNITGMLDMDQLLPAALGEVARVLRADRGAVLFLNKADELIPRVTYPPNSDDLVVSRTITETVLKRREAILSSPSKGDSKLRDTVAISKRDVGSVLCVPLKAEDRVRGVLYLDTRSTAKPFTEQSLRLLSAMALHLAIAIENATLYHSLRNAEEFASSILKSMASGLLVVDQRGVVVRANDGACSILKLAQKELVGLNLAATPNLHEISAVVEQTRTTGIPTDRAEVTVSLVDQQVPLGVSTSMLEDYGGHTTGVLCTFRDLSRLKKMAEEVKRSQQLASLGEMAAGIAHEVRNPLNSVQGFAQLLLEAAEKRADNSEAEYAGIIIEEVGRIDRIVQDLLDFARQRGITMSAINIADLLSGIVRQVQPEAKEKSIEIQFQEPPEPRPVVMGSVDKLKQLFLNVIRNAYQSCSPGGKVEAGITVGRAPNGVYPEAIVNIKDDGCGMPQETLDKIFNPFFTTKDIGTGLGLSICQKIAEQHSGRIEVDSTPGLGSTFSVHLPMRE